LDLSPWLTGTPAEQLDRTLFAETDYEGQQRAVRQGRWKLLISPDGTRSTGLFDLVDDPREMKDKRAEQPAIAARLLAALAQQEKESLEVSRKLGTAREKLSAETLEKLRAVGYTP
jgi:arylsulfatase A-like enzyme